MHERRAKRKASDSDGGADGTVGKLSVMRVWCCCTSDFSLKKSMPHFGFPPSHVVDQSDRGEVH